MSRLWVIIDSQWNPISSSLEAATQVMANELPQSCIRLMGVVLSQAGGNIPVLEEELRSIHLDCHDVVVAIRSESLRPTNRGRGCRRKEVTE